MVIDIIVPIFVMIALLIIIVSFFLAGVKEKGSVQKDNL